MNVTRTCLASPKLAIALALAASCASLPAAAQAMTDAQLAQVVGQRLHGERTGACMAVAVIQGDQVVRSYQCANEADSGRIGPDAACEIGWGRLSGMAFVEAFVELELERVACLFGLHYDLLIATAAGELPFIGKDAVIVGDLIFVEQDGEWPSTLAGTQ